MKLFFEGHKYKMEDVENILDDSIYEAVADTDDVYIPYVGYYYSPLAQDSVFILPKVFLQDRKAFGVDDPRKVITHSQDSDSGKITQSAIFELSVWLYRAIAQFVNRNSKTTLVKNAEIQKVVSYDGKSSQTFLDVILALLQFHKEYRNLFTYIAIINSSGRNKIHWGKTIAKTQPFIQDGDPYYLQFKNKSKTINYDEEIIVLFYSVINYLREILHFRVKCDVNYNLLPARKIEAMLTNGKGTRLLKSIRKKYFTDKLIKLWNLLYTFFDMAEQVKSNKYAGDRLLVKSFHIVFEDMIDRLIGGQQDLPKELKDQEDGKIVDHLFKDRSLFDNNDIYYIGDSKYYRDDSDLGKNSIYKQFTYAKNVIQYNIDITLGSRKPGNFAMVKYRDELTEGYNVTPNFFIRGFVDMDNISYADDQLSPIDDREIRENKHFANRLFDRDTLLLKEYNINFLYVLAAYVSQSEDENYKKTIRKKFRDGLVQMIKAKYRLFKVTPHNGDIEDFVNSHFRKYIGKMYHSDKADYIWMAFDKKSDVDAYLNEISLTASYEEFDLQ